MRITSINGIGEEKARTLRAHGYEFAEDVAFAPLLHFEQVPDVTYQAVVEAQKLFQGNEYIGVPLWTGGNNPRINQDAIQMVYCEGCWRDFGPRTTHTLSNIENHTCENVVGRDQEKLEHSAEAAYEDFKNEQP